MWAIVAGGFVLGLLGSVHCIGMCGPLALSLPVYNSNRLYHFFSLLCYQLGRVFTYSLLGLLLGLAGRQLQLASLQQGFSIITGVLILLSLFFYAGRKQKLRLPFLDTFYKKIQQYIIFLMKGPQSLKSYFLLGLANGLLPCGMVYIAIAGALSSNSLTGSTGFMAAFGAGTMPAMMLVSYFGLLMKPTLRKQLQQVVPVTMALMGVLLVLRGLNLGIPYISPILPGVKGEVISCH